MLARWPQGYQHQLSYANSMHYVLRQLCGELIIFNVILTCLRSASCISLTTSFTPSFSPFTTHLSELLCSICRCSEFTLERSWFISSRVRRSISSGENVCVEHWSSYARWSSLQASDTSLLVWPMTRNAAMLSVSGKDVTRELKSKATGKGKEWDLDLVDPLCPLVVTLVGTSGPGAENG